MERTQRYEKRVDQPQTPPYFIPGSLPLIFNDFDFGWHEADGGETVEARGDIFENLLLNGSAGLFRVNKKRAFSKVLGMSSMAKLLSASRLPELFSKKNFSPAGLLAVLAPSFHVTRRICSSGLGDSLIRVIR